MSAEENKALVRKAYAEMDHAHDMKGMPAYLAPGFKASFPGMPPIDVEGFVGFGGAFFAAFPDLTHSFDSILAEDDLVAFRLRIAGTHKAPLQGPSGEVPATGKAVVFYANNQVRFTDGKLTELWCEFDMLGLLKQLGVA